MMDEEVAREGADAEFEMKREEQRKRDAEKTEKNRKRRGKNKARKGNKDAKEKDETAMEAVKDGESSVKVKGSALLLPEQQPGLEEAGVSTGTEEVGVIIHDDE